MRLQFLGAAGTVTGSCYLLSDGSHKILIDMGIFQGSEELEKLNHQPLKFDPGELSAVVLTHAHMDHVGRMPILVKHGFFGKVYMTAATREIAEIALLDAAKIMKVSEDKSILYTEEDVFSLLNRTEIVSYADVKDLGWVKIIFRDAGHILGSASVELHFSQLNKTIVFSGDLGNSPQDLVKPTEYIDSADIVIMESTYGDRNHPNEDPDDILISEIKHVEDSRGALLIPSFSIDRTQALLHKIAHFKKEGRVKPETSVYLDSPMAQAVTQVYKRFPELYSLELLNDTKTQDPFSFPGLKIVQNHNQSQKTEEADGAKVIIAGSGMMTGGRILEHAIHLLPQKTTRLLIVGFQAQNTLGYEIEQGARTVTIAGQTIKINATVTALHSMSAHADQRRLLNWMKKISGVQKVFLVHGEDTARIPLAKEIKKQENIQVILPRLDDKYEI